MTTSAFAATATLDENAVIIDNDPFYTVDANDSLGAFNFALNDSSFIDIPYAIFGFGGASSVTSAVLTLDYLEPYLNSVPTDITLYVGGDADGSITVNDRFMGTAIDTFSYLAPGSRMIDVTSAVNDALTGGLDFAIRLEVDAAPGTFQGFLGGQSAAPSIEFTEGVAAVPLPASLPLMIGGLAALGAWRRRTSES